jgi:hypothetical protein
MAAGSPTQEEHMKHPTWQQCGAIVVVVLGVGLILNLWRPLFLAPPYIDATWLAYALLGFAWLPVLGVCLLFKPTGRMRTPILLAVLGMLVAAVGFCVGPALPAGFWGTPMACQVISNTPPTIRYECVVDRMFVIDKYVVEGLIGLPIVWLKSHVSVNL